MKIPKKLIADKILEEKKKKVKPILFKIRSKSKVRKN